MEFRFQMDHDVVDDKTGATARETLDVMVDLPPVDGMVRVRIPDLYPGQVFEIAMREIA